MDLKTYFQSALPADRKALADRVDKSVGYLEQIARGTRKPSAPLARRLVEVDPRFTLSELRPDIWGGLAVSLVSPQHSEAA